MDHLIYRWRWLLHLSMGWLFQYLTPGGWGILVSLIIVAIVSWGSTESLIHLLFFFALALLILAGVGTRFIQYQFRVTRILPRFGTVGEPLQYQVILHNLTPDSQQGLKLTENLTMVFPSLREFIEIKKRHLWDGTWRQQWRKHVESQRTAIGHMQDLPPLKPETKTKVNGEILPLRRGRLDLQTVTLACADPLGLIYRRQTYDCPQSVCILPARYHLPALNLSNARRYQMGDHTLASSIGEALEFRSLRDYRPGDPTNKIHWKSWAKVGRPIVKEQQEESAVHHALILDTFHPDAQSQVFEEAIAIAVSFLTQDQPEETKLDIMFAEPAVRCVTVGRGLRQRAQVLESIATLTPCQNRPLDILTPIFQSRVSRLSGCFCILLNLDETRYAFLRMLAQSGIPCKAIVLCDQKTNLDEDLCDALAPHCLTHLVSIDTLQEDLLRL
jgi:uncharacterized protein (DUF58 family)